MAGSRSRSSRLRTAAQIAVGFAGAVCIGFGLAISWRARPATPALVVGGVLIVVAFIGDRWESLTLRRGDLELVIKAQRELGQLVVEGLDALETKLPEELKPEVSELREAAEVIAQPPHAPGLIMRAHVGMVIVSGHKVEGDLVTFTLRVSNAVEDAFPLELEVRRVDGTGPATTITDPTGITKGGSHHSLSWRPDGPGRYRATWLTKGVPIVTEEFDLPEV